MVLKWIDQCIGTITTETEEQNVEKIKTVFPNSLQGNGRTPKWKDQELRDWFHSQGRRGKAGVCVHMSGCCLSLVLTPSCTERREETIGMAVQDCVKVHLIWYPALYTAWKLMSGRTGQIECPFLGNSWQAVGRHLFSRNCKGNSCAYSCPPFICAIPV